MSEQPARLLKLPTRGTLRVGSYADLVVLQAADAVEAIRLSAERLFVLRRGKVLAQASPRVSTVRFAGVEQRVDFTKAGLAGFNFQSG